MSKLSIVVPVYYNEMNIADLYADLKEKVLYKLESYEIVMVDDGSGDSSWAEMNKIAAIDSNVRLLKLSKNFGSHAAILAGLNYCTGDCAMIKAADLQEPSSLILEMYESWKKGNKVVLAAREDREESKSQKGFANTYYWLVRKFVSSEMPKSGFDCYLIDRKVIDVLTALDESNSALTLQVLWAGFKKDVIYYKRLKREKGKSRWTLSKKVKLVVDSIVTFSYTPLRIVSAVGALGFLAAVIWGIVVLMFRIFGDIPVQGYTTLMIFQLLSSGLILLVLGVLGEYIWRGVDAARHRPVFIVDDVVEARNKDDNQSD